MMQLVSEAFIMVFQLYNNKNRERLKDNNLTNQKILCKWILQINNNHKRKFQHYIFLENFK